MDETYIRLTVGLLLTILANTILKTSNEKMCGSLNWKKCCRCNLQKGILVAIGAVLLYFAATINPSIVVIETSELTLTLMGGLHLIIMTGFIFYGASSLKMLVKIMQIKIDGLV